MTEQHKSNDPQRQGSGKKRATEKPEKPVPRPGWADGLRELYDSVVKEPLPESVQQLLDKLDDPN